MQPGRVSQPVLLQRARDKIRNHGIVERVVLIGDELDGFLSHDASEERCHVGQTAESSSHTAVS